MGNYGTGVGVFILDKGNRKRLPFFSDCGFASVPSADRERRTIRTIYKEVYL